MADRNNGHRPRTYRSSGIQNADPYGFPLIHHGSKGNDTEDMIVWCLQILESRLVARLDKSGEEFVVGEIESLTFHGYFLPGNTMQCCFWFANNRDSVFIVDHDEWAEEEQFAFGKRFDHPSVKMEYPYGVELSQQPNLKETLVTALLQIATDVAGA